MFKDNPRLDFPRSRGVPHWPELSHPDFCPVSKSEFDQLANYGQLHEVFDLVAMKHPDRLAVVGSESLHYRELRNRSLQAASALIELGVRPGDIVCIMAKNDWRNIATMLGALRIGATCNLSNPIHSYLDDAPPISTHPLRPPSQVFYLTQWPEIAWLNECTSDHRNTSFADASDRVYDLESLFDGSLTRDPSHSELARYTHPAFVFFTSGSTGKAQAVAMSHQFILLDIARQINDLAIRPSDRMDLLFAPNFSAFLAPTFLTLLTGASLWIRSLDHSIPPDLVHWLIESQITISNMSVSLMRALLNQLPDGSNWPSLRILCAGAEPLRASDVTLFRRKTYARSSLQNAMAATETRTYAQCFFDHQSMVSDPIPIGYPVLDRHVEILNEHQTPVPEGEIGQIRISANRLADGYWDSSQSSSNSFQRLGGCTQFYSSDLGYFDSAGLLYCVGRQDSMVKIRGQKVYLSQVESEILRLEGISNAFAFAFATTQDTSCIVACVESLEPNVQDLVLSALSQRLPTIAQPSRIFPMSQFPRTSTGKINRQELIEFGSKAILENSRSVDHPAPENPVYGFLSTFLNSSVGSETRIKSLGIDSIQSLDLCIQLAKQFSKRISWSDIESCETCQDLAIFIDNAPASEPVDWLRASTEEQPKLILFTSIVGRVDQFGPLLKHLLAAQSSEHSFGLAVVETARMQLPKGTSITIPSFVQPLIEPILEHTKRSPVILGGHSWGGLIAFELARQLQLRNHPIQHLVLMDTVMRKGVPSNRAIRWFNRFRNLPNWVWNEAIHMSLDDWKRESTKKMRRLRHPERNDHLAPENSVYDQQYRAATDFYPSLYHGQTTVIRANTQSLTRPVFGALGWEKFVNPKPQIRVVTGNHLSILNATSSQSIARLLLELIDSSKK
jgi:acyl-coenzyme A synthetase/AMP-(fatty) acid ligase/thioesterase domain-containing protein/acyl carrier protein